VSADESSTSHVRGSGAAGRNAAASRPAATLVTTGVAVSLLPIVIRVLPPLARDAHTTERDPDYAVTVVGLFVYVVVVGAIIALINID
jgi:hypothetical protein